MPDSNQYKLPESGRHREVSAAASDRRAPSNQHSEQVEWARNWLENVSDRDLQLDKLCRALVSLEEQYAALGEKSERQATNIGALYRQRRDAELACELSREENTRLKEQLETLRADLYAVWDNPRIAHPDQWFYDIAEKYGWAPDGRMRALGDGPLTVEAVYRDDAHGCTSLRVIGGPKPYMRIWDPTKHPEAGRPEWGWTLNDLSVPIWEASYQDLRTGGRDARHERAVHETEFKGYGPPSASTTSNQDREQPS